MKTLIIENQYAVDPEIEALIRDNPDTFDEDPKRLVGSLHRSHEEIVMEIGSHDALVASSTFMDKDQLEGITRALASMEGKKVFIKWLESKVEEWTDPDGSSHLYFHDFDEFMENVKRCFARHEVYSFEGDSFAPDEDRIKDDIWERMRFKIDTGRPKFEFKRLKI